MNIETFKKRFKAAETRKRVNWETLYRQAMELFTPQRENFYRSVQGEKKGRQIYTSSPYIALDKAANNIHSAMTPHMKKWIHLKPGRSVQKEAREQAADALVEIRNVFFDHVQNSNFDLAVSEFYKDVLIGTGAILFTSTAKNPFMFTAIPLEELYITSGANNTIDTVFRKFTMRCGAIKDQWDDAEFDDDLERMVKDDPDKEVCLMEGTIPQKIKIFGKDGREHTVDGFVYCVMQEKGSRFLVKREMPVSPWIVARWSVFSGETWGRGPAIVTLDDAKTLNDFVKLNMQGLSLTVHPMWTVVDDGIINISAIRTGPGAMIPVSANDGAFGPSIAPLRGGGDFQASQIEINRLETAINSQMYTEPLGPLNLPVKSATEMSLRQQAFAKQTGGAYARLQYEFILPLVNIGLYHLDRLGLVDMGDFKVDGHTIAIEASSPLAYGQSQDEITNVMTWVQFVAGTFGPEAALSLVKVADVARYLANEMNVPPSLTLTESEQQAAEQQAMIAAQQAQAAGEQDGQAV